ncbi:hypothetical protein DVH05_002652 [Phytophthora capsici]|nr:hypothetical protein DVH05_002652 [Phytophthora capsici]
MKWNNTSSWNGVQCLRVLDEVDRDLKALDSEWKLYLEFTAKTAEEVTKWKAAITSATTKESTATTVSRVAIYLR